MTDFIKYSSIENSYHNKFINGKMARHPELLTCKYIVQQKMDGSNLQIRITPDAIRYGRRNDWIEDNGISFNNHLEIMSRPPYVKLIQALKSLGYDDLIIFGEIFGEGINRRLDYGKNKYILFFDMIIDGIKLTQEDFYKVMDSIDCNDLIVETYGIYDSYNDALEVPNFRYNGYGDPNGDRSFIEGTVIKPYNVPDQGFVIKNKNEQFNNLMGTSTKKVHVIEDAPENVAALIIKFENMIDNNRIIDTFSKMGEIQDPKDIGKYLKFIQTDAIQDYLKENRDEHSKLDTKWQKRVFSGGPAIIVEMLKEYL